MVFSLKLTDHAALKNQPAVAPVFPAQFIPAHRK